jgi:hypothetical protein
MKADIYQSSNQLKMDDRHKCKNQNYGAIKNYRKNFFMILDWVSIFLDKTPKVQASKAKIDKGNHTKLRYFCIAKKSIE